MGMMDKMMGIMMGRLSRQEKDEMMDKMMVEMMPKMLTVMTEGIDFEKMAGKKDEMMDKMMQNDQLKHKLPIVKTHMMPGCIRGMLPELTPEQRLSFALEVNSIIKEKATLVMTEKEKQAFLDKIAVSITG